MKLLGFPRFLRRRAVLLALVPALACATAQASDALQEAQANAKQGRWAPALERVDQYLSSRPRDSQARLLKGVILVELNRHNEALAIFSKLAEEFPELPEPHNNMAVIYAQQKQYDKARNALQAALKSNPSYAAAHENLGDIYARLASQAYDKALQTDSANTAPAPKLALLRAVTTLPKSEQVAARPPAPAPAPAAVVAQAPAPAPPPQIAPAPAPATVSAPKPAQPPAKPASATVAAASAPTLVPGRADKPEARPEAKPEAKPAQDAGAAARLEVGRAIQGWAAAWSRKDVKNYLGAYARDFQPPGRQSRGAWEAERTQRVGKPGKIEVDIDNLRVAVEGDTATAYFRQTYSSTNLNSAGPKVLVMVKREGRWQIQQERVGR